MDSSLEHGILWRALTNPNPNRKPFSINKYQGTSATNSDNLKKARPAKPLKEEQREKYNARRRISSLNEIQRERKRAAQRVSGMTKEQIERRNARRRVITLNAEQLQKKRNRHKFVKLTEEQRLCRNARRREYMRRKQMQSLLRMKLSKNGEGCLKMLKEEKNDMEVQLQGILSDNKTQSKDDVVKSDSISQNNVHLVENCADISVNNNSVKCKDSFVASSSYDVPREVPRQNIDIFIDLELNQSLNEENDWKNCVLNWSPKER